MKELIYGKPRITKQLVNKLQMYYINRKILSSFIMLDELKSFLATFWLLI